MVRLAALDTPYKNGRWTYQAVIAPPTRRDPPFFVLGLIFCSI
jgi:hypothetical protein